MNKKYFWKDATGLNADIDRHRAKEQELVEMIARLEKIEQPSEMDVACLRTYRHFLYQLELSKAEVVTKIGKK